MNQNSSINCTRKSNIVAFAVWKLSGKTTHMEQKACIKKPLLNHTNELAQRTTCDSHMICSDNK